jgi:hypothetical protein
MTKFTKIILLAIALCGIMLPGFADRGVSKKNKNKVALNVRTTGSFTKSLSFNLRSGLKYTGSLLSKPAVSSPNSSTSYNTLVTYQKGNSVYILPYKQKIIVPEVRQGYTGMKLIIKAN